MSELLTLHVFADDLSETQSRALLDWCMSRGADTFTVEVIGTRPAVEQYGDLLDKRLARYAVPPPNGNSTQPREQLWLPEIPVGAEPTPPTQLWFLTSESADILWSELSGLLLGYRPADAWLENPALYRGPDLMLGVVSHEFEGVLRIWPDEQRLLDETDIPYRLKSKYVGY